MVTIFLLDTYSLDIFSRFSKGNTPTLSENWRPIVHRVEEKASRLAALGQIHGH